MLLSLSGLGSLGYPLEVPPNGLAPCRSGYPSGMADQLAIYLNDHLAGATLGRELSKRALGSNRGAPLGEFLESLHDEIVEDRETLLEVMAAAGAAKDPLKQSAALLGERVGRLKPNGRLLGYSPLSRIVELEGLTLGVRGKLSLWELLGEAGDPRLSGFDFDALAARAQRQLDGLTPERIDAGRIAFAAS